MHLLIYVVEGQKNYGLGNVFSLRSILVHENFHITNAKEVYKNGPVHYGSFKDYKKKTEIPAFEYQMNDIHFRLSTPEFKS